MRRMIAAAMVLGAGVALLQQAAAQADPVKARADMRDKSGKSVGTVTFQQMSQGVLVRVQLRDLPAGWHAIHIHETASCEPPFASAGGHLNPSRAQHGLDDGPHPGDLPNIYVDSNGQAHAEMFNALVALAPDRPTEVEFLNRAVSAVQSATGTKVANALSGNGSSVVIHSGPDDYTSEPAGNSGDRIACGVVERG